MSDIVGEIRQAYASIGITLDQPATYGTYYRLLCGGCGKSVGHVGDRLLPGMAQELVDRQFDLYAMGLLGCACGHQRGVTRDRDAARWQTAQARAPRET
ncbi:MAG: hypothetical protein HYU41_23825 [Candidatus Rokubacteria bacterium]|nr:hypothetical protein [Candidatus Rokubacteria bacterium]